MRPWSFPAAVMPALVAMAFLISRQGISLVETSCVHMLLIVLAAVLIQAGGNIISDYYDFKYKVDRKETFGSSRMLVDGIFEPRTLMVFSLVLFAIASAIGVYLALVTSINLLWLGLLGMVLALFYYKFKYSALGDVFVFLTFGQMIAWGTGIILTSHMLWELLVIAAPVGLLIVAILHANNMRDMQYDQAVPIKTVSVMLGLKRAQVYYALLEILPYVIVIGFVVFGFQKPYVLITGITLPLAINNIRKANRATRHTLSDIKDLDGDSAKLVVAFSTVFIITLIMNFYL